MKLVLRGRPTQIYDLPSSVALMIPSQALASLAKGLSSLPTGCASQWLILVAHNQWESVQDRLGCAPEVQLVIEGEVLFNPKTPVTLMRAQHVQVVRR